MMVWEAALPYLRAFLVGGLVCVAAQVLLDLGRMNPAHVMVSFVCLGAVLSGLGWYGPLAAYGGAGATVPLTGFGHALYQGIVTEVQAAGGTGLLTGGLRATSLGITVAILSAVAVALVFEPKG